MSSIKKVILIYNYDFRYASTSPTNISVGDIVEARLSFLAAPATHDHKNIINNDFKLVIILRSLALIDNTFSKVDLYFSVCFPELIMQLESCPCCCTGILSKCKSFKVVEKKCEFL